ncbi:hypothetical protein [Pseudooceanicola sp.]|uniref:head-tail connector protein n=1 Tax=Pseudooceanicola sp. TaxID=1914328 RepID=UPI0035155849
MKPILVAAPVETPVTLAEAKDAARVDFDDDDQSIGAYLAAAVAHLDGYSGILGRCLVSQTWRQGFDGWTPRLRLPFPDVADVSVKYVDADGVEQAVAAAEFEAVEGDAGAEVIFSSDFTMPTLSTEIEAPVQVEFVAGYGAAEDVPADIKMVIKALTRHWYDGEAGEPAQMRLIEKYRCRPL